jgi:DNA-binding CsgD family transcriptional regulator
MNNVMSGHIFTNELPEGVTTIKTIRQKQKWHFTDEEIKQVTTSYTKDRMSVYQLADKFGCNRNTISNVLKKNGVTVTRNRMDKAAIKQATELYATGLTLKAVGEQMSISVSTIRRTLIMAGIKMREPHRYAFK